MNIHLGYRPGCIGRIVELHAGYYARTAGFGVAFEAKVASGLAAFCVDYQEGRDGLWLAEQDGVIHGSIAIDAATGQWTYTLDNSISEEHTTELQTPLGIS